jgi:hypothetical protein
MPSWLSSPTRFSPAEGSRISSAETERERGGKDNVGLAMVAHSRGPHFVSCMDVRMRALCSNFGHDLCKSGNIFFMHIPDL